jgi:cell division inhibitor SepF
VVLNLSRLTPDLAQRAADLVSGGVHALDGQQQRISETVLLLAPAGVAINRIAGTDRAQP